MFDLGNIQSFLTGVNKFYTQFDRREINNPVIWQEGSTKVVDYSVELKNNLPILFFIPSLINKSYILDLTEETSLVRYFAAKGYRVYLVDFTEPLADELNMGFVEYTQRISRAIDAIAKQNPVVSIGYCLGGVFSCALHSSAKLNLVGQILIATPWDFSHLKDRFSLNNPLVVQNLVLLSDNLDKIPPSMVQLFFSYLDSSRIWNKFCQFSYMHNQQEIDKFLAIEQWVNDGISITRKFALESLTMIVDNKQLFVVNCKTPCLLFSGKEDKIVPPSSCMPLYSTLANSEILVEETGHIGLIVSKLAREKIWPKIEGWLNNL